MATTFILSYLAHDETPSGMDFLTNSSVHSTREDAEAEAQGIHNDCADMNDSKPGPLNWTRCARAEAGQTDMAWLADDGQHMFLIRRVTIV